MLKKVLLSLILLFFSVVPLMAEVEIVLWHAFEGFLLEKFQEIVDDFNHSSGAYHIRLVYAGNYTETFEKGIQAAMEGNHPPHILQVYEVATETMMESPDIFRPVDQIMTRYYRKFDPGVYIDTVRIFYSTREGKMYSLPWNASTGILFYNKKLFQEIGLDPEKPPKTWEEVESIGSLLVKSGYKGFVTAWPAAYHLEHFCALHNLPFTTLNNGFGGKGARLMFNGPDEVFHLGKLVEWEKSGIFSYQGRFVTLPEKFFAEGKCGMLLQGANRMGMIQRMTNAPIGVGFIPYWSNIIKEPYGLNVGGSSFWAIEGFSEEIYRGIAHFFSYLSMPEIQSYWHEKTGYLPITEAAYYLAKKRGFYKENPAAEIAVLEVMTERRTENSNGIRLGNYVAVREKIIDKLEDAFSAKISPKEALDQAVLEGNVLLEEYKKVQLKINNNK